MRRYQRLIYTVPRRAGLSEEAAADVFQACFARLVEYLDRIEDASRVRAWLVTTARRETLRCLQAQSRVGMLDPRPDEPEGEGGDPFDQLPSPDPLPEALLADLQQQHLMSLAVERLDPRGRQLVELMFLQAEPLPYAEIALRLGIAEGSIGPTRARVLDKLRVLMDKLSRERA
ncbi:MAG: sigma-70 family RNA polymerase sigma factor [Rubrivivax sp.]|nr:sigma-70 family RNA polymerase sigma factor [Rubrivivax sp.]